MNKFVRYIQCTLYISFRVKSHDYNKDFAEIVDCLVGSVISQ